MQPLIRPMLAAKFQESAIRFPVLASPKYDGVRAIIINSQVRSRSMKLIPNQHVQALFGRPEFNNFDGELIVGSPTDPHCYTKTTSGVMSIQGQPQVAFWVFDCLPSHSAPQQGFHERIINLQTYQNDIQDSPITLVPHTLLYTWKDLYDFETAQLAAGYEGIILRSPYGAYKQGRSTVREGGMIKLKRFLDAEAVIVGSVELLHNDNPATLDERGYTKRSKQQNGLVPTGLLGALVVKTPQGQQFEIGTGFTTTERQLLWARREQLPGQIVKYKYFPYGQKDKPRQPVYVGFRAAIDMD